MTFNGARDLLDPPCLAETLRAHAALRYASGNPSSVEVDVDAAVRVALEVCERTAALLRAQIGGSVVVTSDVTSTHTTVVSTKTIYTQRPDGTWSSAVVLCEPRAVVVDAATVSAVVVNILARMQDELQREVMDFLRKEAARDLGRVRIASKTVHEAMMGTDLDLFWLDRAPSVDKLTMLGRGVNFHKFRQVPMEQSKVLSTAIAEIRNKVFAKKKL